MDWERISLSMYQNVIETVHDSGVIKEWYFSGVSSGAAQEMSCSSLSHTQDSPSLLFLCLCFLPFSFPSSYQSKEDSSGLSPRLICWRSLSVLILCICLFVLLSLFFQALLRPGVPLLSAYQRPVFNTVLFSDSFSLLCPYCSVFISSLLLFCRLLPISVINSVRAFLCDSPFLFFSFLFLVLFVFLCSIVLSRSDCLSLQAFSYQSNHFRQGHPLDPTYQHRVFNTVREKLGMSRCKAILSGAGLCGWNRGVERRGNEIRKETLRVLNE